jgi:shikimate kinase
MNHIVIIGFMGSGKTRVGKRLAEDLSLPFIDVDRAISKRMNMTIREIFERFGEPFYRAMETMMVKELSTTKERFVVSLGAGLPMQEQNAPYLKKMGTIVYLKGSLETLKKRIGTSDDNPMIGGEDREEKMKKLLKQREPVYAKFADVEVVTGVKPFEDLIKEIESKVQ